MALGRLAAALGMDRVVGQPRRARHMRPGQPPAAPDARLVAVQHRRALERRFELFLDWLERLGALLHPLDERPH